MANFCFAIFPCGFLLLSILFVTGSHAERNKAIVYPRGQLIALSKPVLLPRVRP